MFQNIKKFFLKLDTRILFCGLVVILFFLNFYTKTFFYGPRSIHQWRQADCYSIAKNYYEEGMHFFEPKIHYQGVKEGRAVSECPLLNYSAAGLWKLFGEHAFIYRLLEYLIFISSMYVLLITLFKQYKSTLLSFFSISIFLTSPLLVYYCANFIADVPALSFSIICFCFFYRFYHGQTKNYFYLSVLFGALAVLLKASAIMGISLVLFFSLVDLLGLTKFFKTEKLFVKKIVPLLTLLISGLIVFVWYRFALQYNNNSNNNIFLLTVLPIWEMDEADILYNLKVLFNNLFPVFLNKPTLFIFFSLVIYVLANFKKLSAFLKYSFVFSVLFFLAYLLFFFQVFNVHDYYLNNLMFFPMVTLFCVVHIVSQTDFVLNNIKFVRLFFFCFLTFNAFHAAAIYRLRLVDDDKMVHWFPFVSEDESKLYKYMRWDYLNNVGRIEDFEPELRKHGIKREDFVLSMPDGSFNISLQFLDQKGFPIAQNHFKEDSMVMDPFFNKHIKYLILSDTNLKRQRAYQRHADKFETFFIKNNIEVLKFKSEF